MSTVIGNKRASQLIQLTSAEVALDDLFYIVDTSAHESKRMSAQELVVYLNLSGSLYALHAVTADTASFILASGVYGTVQSASVATYTVTSVSSSWASSSVSSSHAITASFSLNGEIGDAQTASFLQYQGVPNGSASYALTSSLTINCLSSSFLIYNIGVNNGTASYSIRTQNVDHATTADTASYFNASIGTVASASIASVALQATSASIAKSASYLIYNNTNNGTASFAIKAGSFSGALTDFGVFSAITQSNLGSILDNVSVISSLGTPQATSVEAVGTVILNYTSSVILNESLTLIAKNRDAGTSITLDSTPIYFSFNPTTGSSTGSIKIPFTLLGQDDLYGNYQVYVTASSNKIGFEPTRTSRFSISSESDALTVSSDDALLFLVKPTSSLLTFSSSTGGPFVDYLPGLYSTGSSNITVVNVNGLSLTDVKYVWTLQNLQELVVSNNSSLTTLTGMPNSLATMSCYSCSITSISNMSNIPTMSYFVCNDNELSALPTLPVSLSYLDCQRNNLTTLPSAFPGGLTKLYCNSNQITSLPTGISASSLNVLMAQSNSFTSIPVGFTFPPLLYTMSLAYNPTLTSIVANWPISMSKLDISSCGVLDVFSMPVSASYIVAYSSSLNPTAIEEMATELVSNGLSNGYLDIRGTGVPTSNALIQLGTLIVKGWTVLKDS